MPNGDNTTGCRDIDGNNVACGYEGNQEYEGYYCDCFGNTIDECGVCMGNEEYMADSCLDCASVAGGSAVEDENGDCCASGYLDACGVCDGPGSVYECGCKRLPEDDRKLCYDSSNDYIDNCSLGIFDDLCIDNENLGEGSLGSTEYCMNAVSLSNEIFKTCYNSESDEMMQACKNTGSGEFIRVCMLADSGEILADITSGDDCNEYENPFC
jgi:hypothetical protein